MLLATMLPQQQQVVKYTITGRTCVVFGKHDYVAIKKEYLLRKCYGFVLSIVCNTLYDFDCV